MGPNKCFSMVNLYEKYSLGPNNSSWGSESRAQVKMKAQLPARWAALPAAPAFTAAVQLGLGRMLLHDHFIPDSL